MKYAHLRLVAAVIAIAGFYMVKSMVFGIQESIHYNDLLSLALSVVALGFSAMVAIGGALMTVASNSVFANSNSL